MSEELNIAELSNLLAQKEAELAAKRKECNSINKEIRNLKSIISINVKAMFSSDQKKIDPDLYGWSGK